MTRYNLEIWSRYLLGGLAFAMVLLLTPRALLEIAVEADSHEIPVDMLEPGDDCLWCTPAADWNTAPEDCDDPEGVDRHWLNPDRVRPEDLNSPCRDEMASEDPSA